MDWFEALTGFVESTGPTGYEATRGRLAVDGPRLASRVNGRTYGIGRFELVSLASLRARARAGARVEGRRGIGVVQGNVRLLHRQPGYAGALFQVASQFNMLEMVGPAVTPEHGVTRYAGDPTQGPACAIAAGAATIYRNYFVPVDGGTGQRADRQLDGFVDLGAAIARALGTPEEALWRMRNGYAMFTADGVDRMSGHVASLDEDGRDALRQRLRIGLHWDVEVTDGMSSPGPQVSQAFCSALPVSYNAFDLIEGARWQPLATLVLEAAYEARLWAAVLNAQRGVTAQVLLTFLGGGAFGNDERWIGAGIAHAVRATRAHDLEIAIVSYQPPTATLLQWARTLAAAQRAPSPP